MCRSPEGGVVQRTSRGYYHRPKQKNPQLEPQISSTAINLAKWPFTPQTGTRLQTRSTNVAAPSTDVEATDWRDPKWRASFGSSLQTPLIPIQSESGRVSLVFEITLSQSLPCLPDIIATGGHAQRKAESLMQRLEMP